MALHGSLRSMPLTDLLQWLGTSRKTGTLLVERRKVVKQVVFRDGQVVACSSDDPPELLGHFLVSQGRITEDVLREALARKGGSREYLGKILVDMRALTSDDLKRHLAAKAEETVFSLFDWDDAEFRFDEELEPSPNLVPIVLAVDDVLLRGLRRFDEAARIKSVFNDPGIVLRRTDRRPPAEMFKNRTARGIYELVTGDRTVAEILLHAHGSEFLVTKFLFELFRNGMVEIAEVRASAAVSLPATPAAAAGPASGDATAIPAPPPHEPAATGSAPSPPTPGPPRVSPEAQLEAARALMGRGEFEGALEILNAQYRSRPGDDSLRRLVAEAEAAFVERTYRHHVPPTMIPALCRPVESLTDQDLSPVEFFLLSRINGTWDVRSIIQITPIREVDALRALKKMREKGYIEVRDAD